MKPEHRDETQEEAATRSPLLPGSIQKLGPPCPECSFIFTTPTSLLISVCHFLQFSWWFEYSFWGFPPTTIEFSKSLRCMAVYSVILHNTTTLILVRWWSVPSPSEFWREVLPRALKAFFAPRFLSVKLQLLVTLLGLASAPSSAPPGDWAFPLDTGALEGLGNTLSFRLGFRLKKEVTIQ